MIDPGRGAGKRSCDVQFNGCVDVANSSRGEHRSDVQGNGSRKEETGGNGEEIGNNGVGKTKDSHNTEDQSQKDRGKRVHTLALLSAVCESET